VLGYSAIVSSFTTRIAGAVVAAVLAMFPLSCSSSPGGSPAHSSAHLDEPVITGDPAAYNTDDIAFANNMIPSQQQGINMSQLVPAHSSSPQVMAFANASGSALQSDIQVLKALRVQWREGGDGQTEGANPGVTPRAVIDDATIAKLDSLHGNAFDKLWLKSMISLDQAKIAMADAEISKGKNLDAVGLARQIVKAMQADTAQLQQMLVSLK
jgi:uncharacterized protein (DUF305 family)